MIWQRGRLLDLVAATALLTAHGAAQLHLAWADSPTIDEPGHLVASLSYTRKGAFRIYNVNPPLSRYVQGCMLAGVGLDTSVIQEPAFYGHRNELLAGAEFAATLDAGYRTVLYRARTGTIFFSLLGGALVWYWGNLVFGRPCGLVGLSVWCLDPLVLGHGHLVSPDVPAAVMALAAALGLRAYLAAPSWPRAAAASALLGLAVLTKFTLLVLCGVWLLALAAAYLRSVRGMRIAHGALAGAILLFTLNAGYLFQDTGRKLGDYRFVSTKLAPFTPDTIYTVGGPRNALAGTWLGELPVPLPAPFLEGIDLQARDFDRYSRQRAAFFMGGEWYEGGRYDYYTYGLIVKTPLAVFGLLAVATVFICHRRVPFDAFLLIGVAVVILGFVSSQKSMNKHVRYVLPMLPFLAILAGAAGRAFLTGRRWHSCLVGLLLGWLLAAGARAMNDPIAYFNEAAGGPRGGLRHLAGSNIDWGQSVYRLRDWLDAHPDFRPLGVLCYGTGPLVLRGRGLSMPPPGPDLGWTTAGVNEQRRCGPHPGRFVVSVRLIQGDTRIGIDPEGTAYTLTRHSYTYFQRFKPVAVVGDSIYVFDVSPAEANRVRAEMGLAELPEP